MQILESVLKACADINRIRILKLLQKKQMCVCELAHVLGITQPSVSRHLKKLKKAGLIGIRQDSFWTNYFLESDNQYANKMLNLIKEWANNDTSLKKDFAKLKKTNRINLCCK